MSNRDSFDDDELPDVRDLRAAAIFFLLAASIFVGWWLFSGIAVIPAGIVAIGCIAIGLWRMVASRLRRRTAEKADNGVASSSNALSNNKLEADREA